MIARLRRPSASDSARALATVAVVLIALQVRLLAVERLPTDFDEDDYLRAGQLYANGLRAGDPEVLLRENYRPEHPPLTKIVTGLALLPLDPVAEIPDRPTTAQPATDLPEPHLTIARVVQAIEGAVGVAALAAVSPLAGLYLAVHSWSIKYTSQVMLEALPAALSMLAVLAYLRAAPRRRKASGRSRERHDPRGARRRGGLVPALARPRRARGALVAQCDRSGSAASSSRRRSSPWWACSFSPRSGPS